MRNLTAERFATLEAVGHAIAQSAPLEQLLDMVMDLLLQAVPAEAATIFLRGASEDELVFALTRGPNRGALRDLRVPVGQGIAGWVVEHDQYAVVPDTAADQRFLHWVDDRTGFHTRSVLCVPLHTRHSVIGAVELLNPLQGQFTASEAAYVTSIANQAAQLIENIRLMQDRGRHVQTLEALRKASEWLNSSLHIKTVLENIVQTADEVMQAEAGSILLRSPDGGLDFTVALGPCADQLMANKDVIRERLEDGIVGLVARSGKPELIPDCSKDPRFTKGIGQELSNKLGFVNRSIVCVPMRARDQVVGVIELINKTNGQPFNQDDVRTLSILADDAAAALTNAQLFESLEASYIHTINSLASALDMRDDETGGHSQRVALYAQEVARQLGLPDKDVDAVFKGSLLHDLGKIGIPDRILLKPGKLDDDEWRIMRRHAVIGYRLVADIDFLEQATIISLCHHERFDGRGYPAKLKREDIPLGARIFAVVDTYDAMTSDRPYRKALPDEAAREEIAKCRGSQFDPKVADAFLAIPRERLDQIRKQIEDLQAAQLSSRAEDVDEEADAAAARAAYEKWRAASEP